MHELDRHDAFLLGDVLRDQIHHRRIDLGLVEVNEVDTELHTQRLDQLCLRDEMFIDENCSESFAGAFLLRKSLCQLFLCDDADVDEHFT